MELRNASPLIDMVPNLLILEGTIWITLAQKITGVIGAGVLSLTWSLSQLGWIVGPLCMITLISGDKSQKICGLFAQESLYGTGIAYILNLRFVRFRFGYLKVNRLIFLFYNTIFLLNGLLIIIVSSAYTIPKFLVTIPTFRGCTYFDCRSPFLLR